MSQADKVYNVYPFPIILINMRHHVRVDLARVKSYIFKYPMFCQVATVFKCCFYIRNINDVKLQMCHYQP